MHRTQAWSIAMQPRVACPVQTLGERHMLRESRQTLDLLQIHSPPLTEPIESLSGGQRQAVAIARAVYWDAKLMNMDEPTNNPGVPEQRKVLDFICRLRERGVPVILITHILPDSFRRRRSPHRHASRMQSRRESDRQDEYGGTHPLYGWRKRRYERRRHSEHDKGTALAAMSLAALAQLERRRFVRARE